MKARRRTTSRAPRARTSRLSIKDNQILMLVGRQPLLSLGFVKELVFPRMDSPSAVRVAKLLLRLPVRATAAERRLALKIERWLIKERAGYDQKIPGITRLLEMDILARLARAPKTPLKTAKEMIGRTSNKRVSRIAWLILGRKCPGATAQDRRDAATYRAWGKEQRAREKEEGLRRRYLSSSGHSFRDDPPNYGYPTYVLVPIDRY